MGEGEEVLTTGYEGGREKRKRGREEGRRGREGGRKEKEMKL